MRGVPVIEARVERERRVEQRGRAHVVAPVVRNDGGVIPEERVARAERERVCHRAVRSERVARDVERPCEQVPAEQVGPRRHVGARHRHDGVGIAAVVQLPKHPGAVHRARLARDGRRERGLAPVRRRAITECALRVRHHAERDRVELHPQHRVRMCERVAPVPVRCIEARERRMQSMVLRAQLQAGLPLRTGSTRLSAPEGDVAQPQLEPGRLLRREVGARAHIGRSLLEETLRRGEVAGELAPAGQPADRRQRQLRARQGIERGPRAIIRAVLHFAFGAEREVLAQPRRFVRDERGLGERFTKAVLGQQGIDEQRACGAVAACTERDRPARGLLGVPHIRGVRRFARALQVERRDDRAGIRRLRIVRALALPELDVPRAPLDEAQWLGAVELRRLAVQVGRRQHRRRSVRARGQPRAGREHQREQARTADDTPHGVGAAR